MANTSSTEKLDVQTVPSAVLGAKYVEAVGKSLDLRWRYYPDELLRYTFDLLVLTDLEAARADGSYIDPELANIVTEARQRIAGQVTREGGLDG